MPEPKEPTKNSERPPFDKDRFVMAVGARLMKIAENNHNSELFRIGESLNLLATMSTSFIEVNRDQFESIQRDAEARTTGE